MWNHVIIFAFLYQCVYQNVTENVFIFVRVVILGDKWHPPHLLKVENLHSVNKPFQTRLPGKHPETVI